MKKVLITMACMFAMALPAMAQPSGPIPYDEEKKVFAYVEVVQLPGVKQDELFDRSLVWIERNFRNAHVRMNQDAKAKGEVELDGNVRLFNTDRRGAKTLDAIVKYKVFIQFRDGRYRYEITRFHQDRGFFDPLEKWLDREAENAERFAQIDAHVRELIAGMKKEIETPFEEVEEDW